MSVIGEMTNTIEAVMINRMKTVKELLDAAYGFEESALMELANFHQEEFSNGPTPHAKKINFAGKDVIRLQGQVISALKNLKMIRDSLREMEGPNEYECRES